MSISSTLRHALPTLAGSALAVCALPALADIPTSERNALIALYDSTQGDSWSNAINLWKTAGDFGTPGTECNWFGVVCESDRVVELHLSNNNLVGTLPALSGLPLLRRFNVSQNTLSGHLPELSSLTSLLGFWANENAFTGLLPELPASMEYFWVLDNQLTGPIPASVSSLPVLTDFRVSTNRLTGTPPAAPASLNPNGSSLCPNLLHVSSDSSINTNWSAATGEPDWSRYCTPGYLVTPSAGAGGSIAPAEPDGVMPNETRAFTVAADTGYLLDGVAGTCGGTLAGGTFTTDAVTADCTVVATFRPVSTPVAATPTPVPTLGVLGMLFTGLLAAGLGAVRASRRR